MSSEIFEEFIEQNYQGRPFWGEVASFATYGGENLWDYSTICSGVFKSGTAKSEKSWQLVQGYLWETETIVNSDRPDLIPEPPKPFAIFRDGRPIYNTGYLLSGDYRGYRGHTSTVYESVLTRSVDYTPGGAPGAFTSDITAKYTGNRRAIDTPLKTGYYTVKSTRSSTVIDSNGRKCVFKQSLTKTYVVWDGETEFSGSIGGDPDDPSWCKTPSGSCDCCAIAERLAELFRGAGLNP